MLCRDELSQVFESSFTTERGGGDGWNCAQYLGVDVSEASGSGVQFWGLSSGCRACPSQSLNVPEYVESKALY